MTQLLSSESPPTVPPPSADHARHWQRLQAERRFRLEQLATLDAEAPPTPRHESVQQALRIAATTALDEIEAALGRMQDGRYGVCVTCFLPIPAERLDVLPMTSLCMACHYNEQNCRLAGSGRGGDGRGA